jgi:hypothetical protein
MADDANTPSGDILARICNDTRAAVAVAKTRRSLDALRSEIGARGDAPRGFGSALKETCAKGQLGLIARSRRRPRPGE